MEAVQRHDTPPMPATLEAAEQHYLELSEQIESIQAQLSSANHVDENGVRLSDHEYHQWRSRAVWALNKKLGERRRIKAWLKTANLEASRIAAGVENPKNVVELVGALSRALKDAVGGENLTVQEQLLLKLAEAYIRAKSAKLAAAS